MPRPCPLRLVGGLLHQPNRREWSVLQLDPGGTVHRLGECGRLLLSDRYDIFH